MFETSLSDFYKLVVTVLKTTFPKSPPKIITHRSYKNVSKDLFRDDLNSLLSKENMALEFNSLTSFTKICIDTLNEHARIKKKTSRKQRKFYYKRLTESNNAKI